jgi:hypothetical protein
MLREVVQLVNEAVNEGHERGVSLFMENLEEDLIKDHIFEEHGGVDPVMATLFEEQGIETSEYSALEELKDEEIDGLMQDLEDSGKEN